METFEYKLVPGFRKPCQLLCIDSIQQVFAFKYIRKNIKYYSCYEKNCSAAVVVEIDSNKYCHASSQSHMHTHGPQTELIQTLALKNQKKSLSSKMLPKTTKIHNVDVNDAPIYEYRLIAGMRSTSNLLCIDAIQQIFKYKNTKNNIKYYYCYQKTCSAGVVVEQNNSKYCRLTTKTDKHNHGTQSELIQRVELINKFKKCEKAIVDANTIEPVWNPFENSNAGHLTVEEQISQPTTNYSNFIKEEPISDTEIPNISDNVFDTSNLVNGTLNPSVDSTDICAIMEEQCNEFKNDNLLSNQRSLDISMVKDQLFEFKIISGFRATSNLLYIEAIQQIFKLKYTRNDHKYYYCYQKNCHAGAIVKINSKYCRLTAKNSVHNHGSQKELIKELERKNKLRETSTEISNTVIGGKYYKPSISPVASKDVNSNRELDKNHSIKEEIISEEKSNLDDNCNSHVSVQNQVNNSELQSNNIQNLELEHFNRNVKKDSPSKVSKPRKAKIGEFFKYDIIRGLRSTSNLLCIDELQQIFKYKYTRSNVRYYYCYQKNCHVGVVVDLDNTDYCRLSGKKSIHTHEPQIKLIKDLKLKNETRKALSLARYSEMPLSSFELYNEEPIINDNCIKNEDVSQELPDENVSEVCSNLPHNHTSGESISIKEEPVFEDETQISTDENLNSISNGFACDSDHMTKDISYSMNGGNWNLNTTCTRHVSEQNQAHNNTDDFYQNVKKDSLSKVSKPPIKKIGKVFKYYIIPGLRSTSNLLCIDALQQIFKYKYTRNNVKYYYCYQKNCHAGVVVEYDNIKYCRLAGKKSFHNHGSQSELIKTLVFLNKNRKRNQKARISLKEGNDMRREVSIKLEDISDENEDSRLLSVGSEELISLPMVSIENKEEIQVTKENKKAYKEMNTVEKNNIFEYRFIPGFRASSRLLYIEKIQQIFIYKYKRLNTKYYTCYQKHCSASVVLELNDTKYCRLTGKNHIHKHGPQTATIEKLKYINSQKKIKLKTKSQRPMKQNETVVKFENDTIVTEN